ncbi:glycosyltransferase [Flavobacterium sp. XS2P39]|uniref:glycosyltransferase n=1 Tax=Flavobacterium sp. XS2P39 TaxID=3401725 RepID=UPI003AABD91D
MSTKIIVTRQNKKSLSIPRKTYVSELNNLLLPGTKNELPEILFITTYPPRECGIATYSQDLIKALNNKFQKSFKIKICPLESNNEQHAYTDSIKYILNTDHSNAFINLACQINTSVNLQMVLIQHEFGLFKNNEADLRQFIKTVQKPVIIVFHTVLPTPNHTFKANVQEIVQEANSVIVMTNSAAELLVKDYGVAEDKITIIQHGTHLVPHSDKEELKVKYKLTGKKILSTFGLLSSGKSIETTLEALPEIVKKNKEVLFLIIGKTHPSVLKEEGEKYRLMLQAKIEELQLREHVKFINCFLPLTELLEYLQLTDIYLFTSKDPNQAVSGTFSYAISCGCPIISTPIPHACEVLKNDAGVIIDFENPKQLAEKTNVLLLDQQLRKNMASNGLHRIAPTAWENAAIAHAMLFDKIGEKNFSLHYKLPKVNLDHVKKLTTPFAMIQFSNINQPDIDSGYTLDDNARAMVAMCQQYEITKDKQDLKYIQIYFNFIKYCLQTDGYFLNYVDEKQNFTAQNSTTNLEDSNGRAIWALGYLNSISAMLPDQLAKDADFIMQSALQRVLEIHSTRAMAFIIKGVYYYNTKRVAEQNIAIIKKLANRLVEMYRYEAEKEWNWFESYLTYGNSILPEAMLCAWLATEKLIYKEIAKSSFDFLLSKIFIENRIHVISNKGWLNKENKLDPSPIGGEQPIDVAYTILALGKFNAVFKKEGYLQKMEIAFNWFLGNNHLQQIIYNPCTGGCYDGLEDDYVNLNQGAESTVSYLMARLALEKSLKKEEKNNPTHIGNPNKLLKNSLFKINLTH